MPGANCSIFGCGTNRRHTGVGIFRIPSGNDERSKVIRDEWIRVITKDRVVDANFRKQTNLATFMCARDILRRWRSNVVSIKQFS
jgi:hypothetical protein